jgi:hypothetical protein
MPSTFVSLNFFVSYTVNSYIYAGYFTSSAHCRSHWLPELGHRGLFFLLLLLPDAELSLVESFGFLNDLLLLSHTGLRLSRF